MSGHRCPASGCGRNVAQDKLMCRDHWFMVPPELRSRVRDTFMHGRGSEAHRTAMDEAVSAVNDRLGQTLF